MCDCDYDPEEPYVDYQGIHYYGGHFQPYFPELQPPKPERNYATLAQVMAVWDKVVAVYPLEKMFEKEDIFYNKLK